MITLHILKLLADNGFGTLMLTGNESGNNKLYFEKLPVGKNGVYSISNGDPIIRGQRATQSFDLLARGANDIDGAKRLEEILNFFATECYPSCDLPIIPGYSENIYKKTIIVPTSRISNVGVDATDRVIWQVSAQVIYNKGEQ
jgi:hypothetical protein